MTLKFTTATAFRQSLESRLMNIATAEGVDIQRLRRQLSFDRLLCRLFYDPVVPWMLKGGYALELRIVGARTTRDVDISMPMPPKGRGKLSERILTSLQDAVSRDLADFFVFTVGVPMQDLAGAPYGGARYPVEARVNGRIFAKFHLDVGVGDTVVEPTEDIHGRDWLGFAGVSAGRFRAISKEQQFAEKVHAYTLSRGGRPNTRVRDLLDMYLLVRLGLNIAATRTALKITFAKRYAQTLEAKLPLPPGLWEEPFAALAAGCNVTADYLAAFAMVQSFYESLYIADTL